MSFDDVEITHKIEARGTGRCTAATQSALAALVPDDAYVSSYSGQNGAEQYWTWSAEWDHSVDVDWRALPDEPRQSPPVTMIAPMMSDGTTERCIVLSPPHYPSGLAIGVLQCERDRGHADAHLFDLSGMVQG